MSHYNWIRIAGAKPVSRERDTPGDHARSIGQSNLRSDLWIARTRLIWSALFVLCFAALTDSDLAFGQTVDAQTVFEQIESINRATSLLDSQTKVDVVDDQTLASARVKLDDLDRDLQSIKSPVVQRLAEINARIDQLEPLTADEGSSEAPSVAEERQALGTEKAALVILIGKIDENAKSIVSATDRIAAKRREVFASALFLRTPISLALFQQALEAGQLATKNLQSIVSGRLAFVLKTKPAALTFSVFGALGVALGLFFGFRRLFYSVLHRDSTIEQPSYFSKIVIGFWKTVLPSIVFAVFLGVTFGLWTYFGIPTPNIGSIISSLFTIMAGVYFIYNLSRAILAPNNPGWRLITIHDKAASKLLFLATTMGFVYGINALISSISVILSAPLALTVVKSFLSSLLIGALIISIALTRAGVSSVDEKVRERWPSWIFIPSFLLGTSIIVATLLGYIGLSSFSAQQVVVTGAMTITMYIGILAGRQIGSKGLLAQTVVGKMLEDKLSLQSQHVELVSILISIIFIILVFMIGIPIILLQWGSQSEDILLWIGKALAGFQIGEIRISFLNLLFGIFVFAFGLIFTRLTQKWLSTSVLPRSNVDSGVRDSITTGIGYFGFALAALIAVTSAGIDLSNLVIVAGALSLGIGFGLQNIASNFVSGLILLVERPIKVGDWIEAGGTSGFVRKISVRATEIETFQKQSVILPNSELINSVVGNWTHKYRGGRIDIPIGVAYGSDVGKVRTVLLGIATENKLILENPPPFVFFSGFGDSSLDFELRFHINDITKTPVISTDVRFAIVDALRENGIEIPFPQRDLHVRTGSLAASIEHNDQQLPD